VFCGRHIVIIIMIIVGGYRYMNNFFLMRCILCSTEKSSSIEHVNNFLTFFKQILRQILGNSGLLGYTFYFLISNLNI